jgi:hypothetical protein
MRALSSGRAIRFWGASRREYSHLIKFIITGSLLHFWISSSSSFFLYGIGDLAKTMVDITNGHGDAAAPTFPVMMYVFLISYVALVLVPYADLPYVFSLLRVVKSACAFVMVISVIKFT